MNENPEAGNIFTTEGRKGRCVMTCENEGHLTVTVKWGEATAEYWFCSETCMIEFCGKNKL